MIRQYFPFEVEQILPFIIIYTEIHHRFKFLGSKYFKREPEIIADIPHRIEPGQQLPLLILIKDSHDFPIHLSKVEIVISKGKQVYKQSLNIGININKRWWYKTFLLDKPIFSALTEINIIIHYKINSILKKCINHNLPIKDSLPMHSYFSHYPYPRKDNIIYGDLHYHTDVTEDMVEFGAPLESTYHAAKALSLDFVCNTDHSYDIDDKIDSWTQVDPKLEKWNNSHKLIHKMNAEHEFNNFIIPSEELSLHNLEGYNIHALILNNKTFLPGQGDGAEKPFDFSCKYNTETLGNALEENSLCIAAHPCAQVPFAQKLFFKRGKWHFDDLTMDHVAGMQILNGEIDDSYYNGLKMWVKLLLSGYKKFIYAGNDAHGNFNKYRQIKIPMISIHEKDTQILGECRTGVVGVSSSKFKISDTVDLLKKGQCFITNGPLFYIQAISQTTYPMGALVKGNLIELKIIFSSTEEFGNSGIIKIFKGSSGDAEEKLITEIIINQNLMTQCMDIVAKKSMYIRAEYEGDSYRGKRIALTNPIWIDPD